MKRKTTLVIELDAEELAFRIAKAAIGLQPPAGTTAKEALDQMGRVDPFIVKGFRDAAHAAMLYFREQTEKGHRPQ